jgi:hypothetical protein
MFIDNSFEQAVRERPTIVAKMFCDCGIESLCLFWEMRVLKLEQL